VIDDRTYAANITNEGGVAGTVRVLRNVTGLWLLHECRRVWALEGFDRTFAELVELAALEPQLRSLVDPNDAVFTAPDDMPRRIREYCERTRQPEPAGPGAVVRCVLESLAIKHAQTIDLLRDATGVTPREVHVVGGGARNELLCRWTAHASGLPVQAGPAEATQIGNLLVQALALGEVGSIEDARDVVRASFEPVVYEPTELELWREARERFEAIVGESHSLTEVDA